MSVMDGLYAARELQQEWPDPPIIVLSMYRPEYQKVASTSAESEILYRKAAGPGPNQSDSGDKRWRDMLRVVRRSEPSPISL